MIFGFSFTAMILSTIVFVIIVNVLGKSDGKPFKETPQSDYMKAFWEEAKLKNERVKNESKD